MLFPICKTALLLSLLTVSYKQNSSRLQLHPISKSDWLRDTIKALTLAYSHDWNIGGYPQERCRFPVIQIE